MGTLLQYLKYSVLASVSVKLKNVVCKLFAVYTLRKSVDAFMKKFDLDGGKKRDKERVVQTSDGELHNTIFLRMIRSIELSISSAAHVH